MKRQNRSRSRRLITGLVQGRIAVVFACGLISACAGTPEPNRGPSGVAELNDDAFEVLFATEFPVQSEEEAMRRAEQAASAGETDQALFYLVRALQFRPDNAELLVRIGDIQSQRGLVQYATRAYLMALAHDPELSGAHEGLGLIFMAQGKDEEALAYLRRAVAGTETLWRAHDVLGVYADKAGDHVTAQYHYDMALAANPDAAQVLNNRGYSKYLAGDIAGARADLLEAADKRGFRLAWVNLGKIYAEGGQYQQAIKTYKLVMSEASALNSAAATALENGDLVEAERYLSEAIRLSPTYFPSAEENLALLKELQHRETPRNAQADPG